MRLVQVGMGGWGRDWAKMLARHGELAQTVACVDVLPEMLGRAQADVGVSASACFPTLEAALEATDAEAVLVTTPVGGHVPVALAALKAGKHVLLEKPFALTAKDCDGMIAAAKESGRILMVAHVLRFWPEYVALVELIERGKLGKPISGVATRLSQLPGWADWPGASVAMVLSRSAKSMMRRKWAPVALTSLKPPGRSIGCRLYLSMNWCCSMLSLMRP